MTAEALARVLHSHTYPWCRQPDTECHCGDQAERILADPAPLLAALAEAGVLTEEDEYRWDQTTYDRKTPQRRYATGWTEVQP